LVLPKKPPKSFIKAGKTMYFGEPTQVEICI
jgi:hypothetical protein